MIPALIALLLSWALLHFVENKSLEALGFVPTSRRIRLIGLGFLLTVVFMTVYYFIEAAGWHYSYHLNHGFSASDFLFSLWTILTGALFEELLFRGALLYILIKRLGPTKAVIISSVAFGMYHWFVVGIHSLPQMLLLFFSMAWMGYALASSFVVSGSILVPLALHFASNFVGADIFGDGPQLFVHSPGTRPSGVVLLLLVTIHNFAYPLVVLAWVRTVKKKKI